ncbi:hypothetical protein, partial [Bosea sp. TAB14]|uniref:hypothetical protein n=1 Tax=Bosea sp. TAB14 TaxID=3237481 RepID=UPI003F8EFB32
MFEAWLLKNWKTAALLVVLGLLFAAGGLGFWRGLVAIERLQDKAATLAREAQDAKWKAQIAEANAAVSVARAEQA